jgi:hypothetical protein
MEFFFNVMRLLKVELKDHNHCASVGVEQHRDVNANEVKLN